LIVWLLYVAWERGQWGFNSGFSKLIVYGKNVKGVGKASEMQKTHKIVTRKIGCREKLFGFFREQNKNWGGGRKRTKKITSRRRRVAGLCLEKGLESYNGKGVSGSSQVARGDLNKKFKKANQEITRNRNRKKMKVE